MSRSMKASDFWQYSDLAWAAGVWDAKGQADIENGKYVRVEVSYIQLDVAEQLKRIFGGEVRKHKSKYRWRCDKAKRVDFLESMLAWTRLDDVSPTLTAIMLIRRIEGWKGVDDGTG